MFWNWFIAFNFFVGVITTLSLLTMALVYIGGQYDGLNYYRFDLCISLYLFK